MFLTGLIAQRDLPLRDMLDRYELYMYKQWLRVYMQSKMIKHNKDLLSPSMTHSRSWTSCISISTREATTGIARRLGPRGPWDGYRVDSR